MNDEVISVLNDLIETSKDGEKGFAFASKDSREPELTALFREGEESCRAAAAELQDQVRLLGGTGEDDGSVKATVHRGWISARTVTIFRDSKELLEECERGEDYARLRYAGALKLQLPEPARTVVKRQFERVTATHHRVRDMRNKYRSIDLAQAFRSHA
jgi:uncharacterized protein (TIGR02284 family)